MKRTIPYLTKQNGQTLLMVDEAPFVILGGELHNSSASDLSYLENHVWPGLRRLGGNCYLVPVYWECLEPEQGVYDYTLVDGVIRQARREGVRLVLLWFGLWKNGGSSYTPAWIKTDPSYFYMEKPDGRYAESVSPFCAKAVEADKTAFCRLMSHLKETDEERTVIMIQVENEVGCWGFPRDYSAPAEAAFRSAVPAAVVAVKGGQGLTWQEAEAVYGTDTAAYFMAWALGSAIGRIAAAGKEIYPLPMFMNCVPDFMPLSNLPGACPSGGPIPKVQDIYRTVAPAIDLYGPDIYAPIFRTISDVFAAENALVIPETAQGKDCVSKALYAAAAHNLVCFSPFGIDGMMNGLSEADALSQMNVHAAPEQEMGRENLAMAYRLLAELMEEIRTAQREHRIWAFYQQGLGDQFVLEDYLITVTYDGMELSDDAVMPVSAPGGPGPADAPAGGGFILRRQDGSFLVCGVSCNIKIQPEFGGQGQVFVLRRQQLQLTERGLVPGRILNGDELNHIALGYRLDVQTLSFYRR
ncbi:MAG: DUF5597 domain-containing protein [Lachnospiraceae bacterium]|nr:DUF5597 domain-containing protein [Lachnospiraceae bacterium]